MGIIILKLYVFCIKHILISPRTDIQKYIVSEVNGHRYSPNIKILPPPILEVEVEAPESTASSKKGTWFTKILRKQFKRVHLRGQIIMWVQIPVIIKKKWNIYETHENINKRSVLYPLWTATRHIIFSSQPCLTKTVIWRSFLIIR